MNRRLPFSLAFGLAIVSSLAFIAQSEPDFWAENVCNRTVNVRKEELVEEPVKYEIKYDSICGILPCTKSRTEVRYDTKVKTTMDSMLVAECCPGYAEAPDRSCKPICLKSCVNGNCIKPDVCECNHTPTETSPGFSGFKCNMFTCLATNKWGNKCDKDCNCSENSFCSANNGRCLCLPGWRGDNCMEQCKADDYDCDPTNSPMLPPMIEPEANMISDTLIMGPSAKLEAESLARGINSSEDESGLGRSIASASTGMNIILLALVCFLMFSIFRYKRRLDQARQELYYGPPGSLVTNSSHGSNTYSPDSTYLGCPNQFNPHNRPRMPVPGEDDFLGKNLSFAAVTRSILAGKGNGQLNKIDEGRSKVLVDPKLESRLINSHKCSQQNVYSDIESNLSERSYDVPKQVKAGGLTSINIIPEENEYQVPRSPTLKKAEAELYEGEDQIYEEINPRTKADE